MLIEHFFLMLKNTVQTKQWLDKCYKESSPSRQMVEKWIGEFKRGRKGINGAERLGRPKDITTSEIIEKIHEIVLDDPKVKVRELAEAAGISIESVVKILHAFGHEIANRKMGAAFANNRSKTPTSSWFRELFRPF